VSDSAAAGAARRGSIHLAVLVDSAVQSRNAFTAPTTPARVQNKTRPGPGEHSRITIKDVGSTLEDCMRKTLEAPAAADARSRPPAPRDGFDGVAWPRGVTGSS